MGAPTATERLAHLAEAMQRDMDLADAYRVALEASLKYVRRAMDNARDAEKFKAARNDYRLCCAALGIEHD